MKIVVFGASGDVGRRVVTEASKRDHEVTAVVRREGALTFDKSIDVSVLDVSSSPNLRELIAAHDVAISALRPPDGEESSLRSLTQTVVAAAQHAERRFVVVGGAATLLLPDASGHTVLSAPGFLPENVVPIATACKHQFDWCDGQLGALGTYLCPPAMLTPGERTGKYRLGSDTLVVSTKGQSEISMEDFSVALVDEAENPRHTGRRFTVGY